MTETNAQQMLDLLDGNTALGIEFGSTRVKAVLVDSKLKPIASGSYEWENQLRDGIWTYSLEDILKGLRVSYRKLATEVFEEFGETLKTIGSIGISGMMHGYLVFNEKNELLVPFRTWRNSMTGEAEEILTKEFHYNIPQRWSVAHLYQAVLNKEPHVEAINYITTLSGYVHWQLTGEKVLGIGDASGMFPINTESKNYNDGMLVKFQKLLDNENSSIKLKEILPSILLAGEVGGTLTEEGAYLIDPTGNLEKGIPFCPPEGDAGTGMVATNSTKIRTGNISAGTSAFAMIVLENTLKEVHSEIDMVTTPAGNLVGMVHANNCSSDINAWVGIFNEFTTALGLDIDKERLFSILFEKALEGDEDCGGLLSYGYYSGENITGLNEGRPLFVRMPNSKFNLANFMRVHLSTAFGAMRIGMDILNSENVKIDSLVGHGGIFKTPEVGQRLLATAMETPVTVLDTAGEGGAWGIAILASFILNSQDRELDEYLEECVFQNDVGKTITPEKNDIMGYRDFMYRYREGLTIEEEAVKYLNQ